jgi:hypothetical protein
VLGYTAGELPSVLGYITIFPTTILPEGLTIE